MKTLLSMICLFSSLTVFSQEKNIVELLNRQLTKEIAGFEKQDSLGIVQPFHIDAANKLVLETKKYSSHTNEWVVVKQELALQEIESIGKDINVIFMAKGDKVLTTTKTYTADWKLLRTDIADKAIFYTEISEEKQNEKLRDQLVRYFKKAGYAIKAAFWYD